jgi:hypothetical protein
MTSTSQSMAKPARRGREMSPEPGPAMRALSPRWQRCVECLFLTDGDRTKAIRLAGYKGTPESLRVMACRIFRDDRVRAAIREECAKEIEITEPELISINRSIYRNVGEKAADRLRAVGMMWDRANPVMTRHEISVEHHLSSDERDVQHYRALKKLGAPLDAFVARFGPHGVARVEAMVLAEEAKQREIEGGSRGSIEVDYEEAEPAAVDEDTL